MSKFYNAPGVVNTQGKTYQYQQYVACNHWRDPIQIGSKLVVASGYPPSEDLLTPPVPGLGVYLYHSWEQYFTTPTVIGFTPKRSYKPPYPAVIIDWADHSMLPMRELVWLMGVIRDAMAEDKLVEVACFGGHGRTGTLLACLIGEIENRDARRAVLAVRQRYCGKAVESASQLRGIARYLGNDESVVEPLVREITAKYVMPYAKYKDTKLLGNYDEMDIYSGV